MPLKGTSNAGRASLLGVLLLCVGSAGAQSYPSKAIRLIVPFPAAGPTDAYARLIGKALQEKLGQPVIVDNRAGATGLIGSLAVRDATPDGYTLLYTSNSAHVIGPLLRKPHSFDPVADFTPIIEPLRYPMYLLSSKKLPVKNFKEFVALGKKQPGKLTYSSVGVGSAGHLGCELMAEAAGISALHVPYKGAAPAQTALIAGETDFMCDSVGNSEPMVLAGKINGLALTAAKRSMAVPAVPTMKEEGVTVEAYVWQGVFAPKGLPTDIRNKLAAAFAQILHSPELTARMQRDGYDLVAEPPEQFAKEITAEKAVWEKIILEKNIQAE